MATVMDDPNYAKPENRPDVPEDIPAELLPTGGGSVWFPSLAHSAFTPQQMEQVFALILTGQFGDVQTLERLLRQLTTENQNGQTIVQAAQDALGYKSAAEQALTDTLEAKNAAETAQKGALDAKNAAEQAQTGALDAKNAAEQAQKDATTQKEASETARRASESAAERAEKAAEQASGAAGVVPVLVGPIIKTLTASGWTGTGPWTQTVNVTGVQATDNHLNVRPVMVTAEAYQTYMDNYDLLYPCFETLDGKVKFTCFEGKPTGDFQIALEGIR